MVIDKKVLMAPTTECRCRTGKAIWFLTCWF